MGELGKFLRRKQQDWCKECKRELEEVRRQLFALPGVSVGHYVEHTDPEFYQENLYIVDQKADIPPGMYACGAIQYRCLGCGKRVTVLDPFLPVRDQEKHEGRVMFRNGELDDVLWL